jgi:hypothetical protein
MAGFGPVGSRPVASVPAGQQGIVYNITTGNAEASGGSYTLTYTFPANAVSLVAAEVLHGGVPVATVALVAAEVLHGGQPEANVTLVAIEVLRSIATGGGDPGFVSILW